MRRRYHFQDFKETLKSVLRSTTFISANAYFAILFFCSSSRVTGKFYYYVAAYFPALLGSFMAISIERPGRRATLAFYVANVASETIFKAGVARGTWPSINKGQVYIFTLSMAILMAMAKKNGFESDPLSTALRFIIGHEEAKHRTKRKRQQGQKVTSDKKEKEEKEEFIDNNRQHQDQQQSYTECDTSSGNYCDHETTLTTAACPLTNNTNEKGKNTGIEPKMSLACLLDRFHKLKDAWISVLTARHAKCPHSNESCCQYVLRSLGRSFVIGYTGQFVLRTATRIPSLIRHPDPLSIVLEYAFNRNALKLGVFLASFSAVFKGTNCALRWATDVTNPTHCFIAGIVAGPTMLMYPSPTVALYVLWKCLEALFHEAVKRGLVKYERFFIMALYALATSQLFYSAILNPKFIKTSYMQFLDRMSDHRLHDLNRSVLDVFGTDASSGYEEFFPDLHPRFMSRQFQECVFNWMIQPF
ncbi:Transmembrane protein [Fragariocoptes setiger]|uniref:Transmembrane protein n=1 Tax=Fragariocoptes setiger TaxID=1670756 RepID=A0ABQ7S9Y2_9ACAR|nr:Transmembrane protein [Fragariocoptes setiger]